MPSPLPFFPLPQSFFSSHPRRSIVTSVVDQLLPSPSPLCFLFSHHSHSLGINNLGPRHSFRASHYLHLGLNRDTIAIAQHTPPTSTKPKPPPVPHPGSRTTLLTAYDRLFHIVFEIIHSFNHLAWPFSTREPPISTDDRDRDPHHISIHRPPRNRLARGFEALAHHYHDVLNDHHRHPDSKTHTWASKCPPIW